MNSKYKSFSNLILLSIITILFLYKTSYVNAQVSVINTNNAYDITDKAQYIVDTSGRKDFDAIKKLKFKNFMGKTGLHHQGSEIYWLKIPIQNYRTDGVKKWVLTLERNYYISVLDVYIPSTDGTYSIKKVGNSVAFSSREIKDRYFAIPFELEVNKKGVIYVKIKSNLYVNHILKIYEELSYYKSYRGSNEAYSVVNGIIVLRFIFSLTFLLLISDRKFRAYCFYGLTVCSTMLLGVGAGPSLYANSPKLADSLWLFLSNIHMITLCYFTYHAALVEDIMPKVKWFLIFMAGFGFIHAFYSWFYGPLPYFMHIYTYLVIGIILVQSYPLIRGYYATIWYLIPAIIFAFFFISSQLNNLGFIDLPNLFSFARNLGLTVELIGIVPVTGIILRKLYLEKLDSEKTILKERNELERVNELDRQKKQLYTNISHELKTPLTLISGPINDLRKKYPDDKLLSLIKPNVGRLQELVHQLLDFQKIEEGKFKFQFEHLDFAKYLKLHVYSFESMSDSKNISLHLNLSKDHFMAYVDLDKFNKIIDNLLSNAIKYSPLNSKIVIDCDFIETPKRVKFSIIDEGVGISDNDLPYIFDRFYQVQNDSFQGSGVGLALVKNIVEIWKGSINVESNIGGGTKFIVSLPIDKDTWGTYIETKKENINIDEVIRLNEPVVIEENLQVVCTEKQLVLIVDDNKDMLSYLQLILQDNYQVITAENGKEGIEKANEEIPDLIISDLMMPMMDGNEFSKVLKSQTTTSHVPIIMLTAKSTKESKLEGFDIGIDHFISKPFDSDELKVIIKNSIKNRALLKAIFGNKYNEENVKANNLLEKEDLFIKTLKNCLEKYYHKSDLTVSDIAESVNLNEKQFRRKLNAVANITPIEFLRKYRLQKAADLLIQNRMNVSEIAFAVGFENLSYFSKVFFQEYNLLPSEYAHN